jgi:uncharacterized delta-60 repeat protein
MDVRGRLVSKIETRGRDHDDQRTEALMSLRRFPRTCLTATLFAGLVIFLVGPAQAASGALDPTFGTDGQVTTAFQDGARANAVVLQPDGKIIAAGTSGPTSSTGFALARYNPDGSLDTSFGSGGKVTTAIGSLSEAAALALQPDGKIVAAGSSYDASHSAALDDFALARYNPDGSLDTSFGSGGKVTTPIGTSSDEAQTVALQPNGKIVVAGYSWVDTGNEVTDYTIIALVRYNADGSLDASFGSGGKVTTRIGPDLAHADAVAVQPDGKIVVAGESSLGTTYHFTLVRYAPDGSLDQTFGTGGEVITVIPGSDYSWAKALVLQPDGKILAIGWAERIGAPTCCDGRFALARYKPDGSLDTSFGAGGTVTTAFVAYSEANALALQADGKIVVAGLRAHTPGKAFNFDFALARYFSNGSLDPSFGVDGKLTTEETGSPRGIAGIVLQPDGKIVATGSSKSGQFVLVRYLVTGSLLTVEKEGDGTGTVTSRPTGIDCGVDCSAPFADGSSVTLTAVAAKKSVFAGWDPGCPSAKRAKSGSDSCVLTMNGDRSIAPVFELACIVPKVDGKALVRARHAIKKARCAVGNVKRVYSDRVRKGRVISQKPRSGAKRLSGARVRLVVSKGKKP